MAKLTLSDLASLTNEASALATLNANWLLIETAMENTFSRDGTSPNTMGEDLDMNSNRIINLPAAASDTEPVRYAEFFSAIEDDGLSFPVSTAGLVTVTSTSTVTVRTLTGTANEITVTTGDGGTGNPTFSLPSAITLTGKTVTGGTFSTFRAGDTIAPSASDGAALGTTALMWSDLFLASGGVINFNNGDVTLTHVSPNQLNFTGASTGYYFDAIIGPVTSDGAPLGSTNNMWSDLFLASGAVVNWNAGDVTLTHAANSLTFAGASSGYSFDARLQPTANDGAALGISGTAWADLFLASGAVINWDAGDITLTHAANQLTFNSASNGYVFTSTHASGATAIGTFNIAQALGFITIGVTGGGMNFGAQSTTCFVDNTSGATGIIQFRTNTGSAVADLQAGSFLAANQTGVGYRTGAGGTVTQGVSKATGVTLNKVSGQITMNNAALASTAIVSFTLTNSSIAALDTVIANIASAASADSYNIDVTAVAAGSCRIQIRNISGGSLSEALVINFNVIKGASS